MRNIKVVIEYDGTNYHGFQRQPDLPTIQGEIERALENLTGMHTDIIGAGRTDAGVHAIYQVANFVTESRIPLGNIPKALNHRLNGDITIKEAQEVPLDFHARRWAKSREYVYNLGNGDYVPMFIKRYVYPVRPSLNIDLMRETIPHLLGEHDFSSFCVVEDKQKDYVRKLYSINLDTSSVKTLQGGEYPNLRLINLTFRANSFLYRMVRFLVGTLLDVGLGKLEPQGVRKILEGRVKRTSSIAPPQGLYLTKVEY